MDRGDEYVLEDKTKVGLSVSENITEDSGVSVDRGVIHDMEGIGHHVTIRWFFPKERFEIGDVLQRAEAMEEKYIQLRELTCPD